MKELASRNQWAQWFNARGSRYVLPLFVLALAGGALAAVLSGRPSIFPIGATGVIVYRFLQSRKNI